MTTEIRLRGWSAATKQMSPIVSLATFVSNFEARAIRTGHFFPFVGTTFMLSTGLWDKYGVEICDGDIVKRGRLITIVKYHGGGFAPFAIPEWEVTEKPNQTTVLGNIYQNPESIPQYGSS